MKKWFAILAFLFVISMDFWSWNETKPIIFFMPFWMWQIVGVTISLSILFSLFAKFRWEDA